MPTPLRPPISSVAAHLVASIFYGMAAFLLYLGTTTMLHVHEARRWVEVVVLGMRAIVRCTAPKSGG